MNKAPLSDNQHFDDESDLIESRRLKVLYYSTLLIVVVLIIFGIYNLSVGNLYNGYIPLLISAGFAGSLVFFNDPPKRKILNKTSAVLMTVLFFWLLVKGAHGGSTSLWFYSLPPVLFFFLGYKEGFYSSLIIYFALVVFLFVDFQLGMSYDLAFKVRFLASLGLVSLLYFGIETFRKWSHDELMEQRKKLKDEKEKLQTALDEITVLRGLLPICSHCKQIRDEDGNWNMMEKYVTEHSEAKFSHSVCPGCLAEHYPED